MYIGPPEGPTPVLEVMNFYLFNTKTAYDLRLVMILIHDHLKKFTICVQSVETVGVLTSYNFSKIVKDLNVCYYIDLGSFRQDQYHFNSFLLTTSGLLDHLLSSL